MSRHGCCVAARCRAGKVAVECGRRAAVGAGEWRGLSPSASPARLTPVSSAPPGSVYKLCAKTIHQSRCPWERLWGLVRRPVRDGACNAVSCAPVADLHSRSPERWDHRLFFSQPYLATQIIRRIQSRPQLAASPLKRCKRPRHADVA